MVIPLVFAAIYDLKQFMSQPKKYFKSLAKCNDMANVILGFVNLYF